METSFLNVNNKYLPAAYPASGNQQEQKIPIFAQGNYNMGLRFKNQRFIFYFLATAVLFIHACANPVSPTGGPKDTTPPEIIRSIPLNQSVNFTGDRVIMTFSEFVTLKDMNTQLVVSPPLSEPPVFSMRGKSMTMKFEEPLRENSTYNFFFGDAIVDLTEANPLTNYSFSFSTGPVLDSLSIKGKLLNAFNLQPVKSAFVMLYDSIYDSVPYKQRPYYLARTSETGDFVLNNLRDSKYLMFALTDINGNYMYDMPTEEIAFLDSLVRPVFHGVKLKPAIDSTSVFADSLAVEPDSLNIYPDSLNIFPDSLNIFPDSLHIHSDSLHIHDENEDHLHDTISDDHEHHDHSHIHDAEVLTQGVVIPSYTLLHFRETDTIQRLLKGTVVRKNVISLAFRFPVTSFTIKPIEPEYSENWAITEYNTNRDTITIWIPEPATDSLLLEVADNGIVMDTLDVALTPALKTAARGKAAEIKPEKLTFRPSLKASKIRPDRELRLTFSDPVASFNPEKIRLFVDTILLTPEIGFQDSLQLHFSIKHKWREGDKYLLEIPDSTFTSIFGHFNDSAGYKFTAITEAESGLLKINTELSVPGNYIIQLLDDKEVLLEERMINENSILSFNYLSARKYKLKAIFDLNGNGKWDTGNFLKKRQPEPVSYFQKEIEMRINWSIEEDWIVE